MDVERLVDLAMQVEIESPIDFGYLSIDERQAYRLMALHVLEMLEKYSAEDRAKISMAVATHLLVENFVLQLKMGDI